MVSAPVHQVNDPRQPLRTVACLAAFWLAVPGAEPAPAQITYRLTFSREVHPQPFTGRVYLFFAPPPGEPRRQLDWFHPHPFLAVDVDAWAPESPLTLRSDTPQALKFPRNFNELNLAGYRVQALARFNPLAREVTNGAGNGYSDPLTLPTADGTVPLIIDRLIARIPFEDTAWTRRLAVRSDLLSRFHKREVLLEAAVTLPRSYEQHPDRRYPTIFEIPGFGGTFHHARHTQPVEESNDRGVEFLRVTLDPNCPLGHHVFADSANNGPVGTALVTELIPAFDREFRSISRPTARFLTGHSSGGWSSLWLQITWPDQFAGVWSTAPDPVDFRDFQRINIYRRAENMYVDPAGSRRPLARQGDRELIWYDDFAWMEHVLGPGGQLHSFEAVFSPRDSAGKPRPLFDRQSGQIDAEVARAWQEFDIRLQLERNWDTLAPQLRGKVHVFMGDQDTFLLEGATRLLQESLLKLGSDAVVEIHPGRNHGSLMTRELRDRIRREMTATFLSHYPEWPQGIP